MGEAIDDLDLDDDNLDSTNQLGLINSQTFNVLEMSPGSNDMRPNFTCGRISEDMEDSEDMGDDLGDTNRVGTVVAQVGQLGNVTTNRASPNMTFGKIHADIDEDTDDDL